MTGRRGWRMWGVLLSGLALSACQEPADFTQAPIEIVNSTRLKPVMTSVFVAAPVNAIALQDAVRDALPDRITRVRMWLERAGCIEKNGRKRCGNVKFEGEVRRNGAPVFRADGRAFVVEMPLRYAFDLTGSGRVSELSKTQEGELRALATYEIALDESGRPQVSKTPTIEIVGVTEIPVFEKSVDIKSRVERALGKDLRSLDDVLRGAIDPDPARELLAGAWRELHYPVRIGQSEDVWLRGSPRSVHFAGLMGSGATLSVRFAIQTPMSTFKGERPLPLIPHQMPAITAAPEAEDKSDDSDAENSETAAERDARAALDNSAIMLPIDHPYAKINAKLDETLPAGMVLKPSVTGHPMAITVLGHRLFPAGASLGLELELSTEAPGDWGAETGRAFMVGLPRIGPQTGRLEIGISEYTAPVGRPDMFAGGTFILPEEPVRTAFANALAFDADKVFADLLAKAEDRFSVTLGSGLRLQGRFDRVELKSVQPGATALKLAVALIGDLTIVPVGGGQPDAIAARQTDVEKSTAPN